jgi:hypothetical protein
MYASVNANGLKTFTSDCVNISELTKRKHIYENLLYRDMQYIVFEWSFNLLPSLV